ncbi:hypothetical protein MNBD_PLANCTO03-894 [hydrothermal vent metagenome]|uniref:Methyltransferase domain-containing protein n=1 Tax=hydrothermal vent metagenome TaxID=652676 RepID=A0A3B1E0C6_9ZZZZ
MLTRVLQRYRPRICPFDIVIDHVPTGARVLDVGCGVGLFLALLARQGRIHEAQGFDSSETAIAHARTMLADHADQEWVSRVSFEQRAVEAGYPEGVFDVVTMIDVMHHVPPAGQQEALLGAIARTVPGGLLVYKDMCRHPRWRAAANRLHDLVMARQWIHYVPIKQIETWAVEAGLVLHHAQDAARLWYGHELRVFKRPLVQADGADSDG